MRNAGGALRSLVFFKFNLFSQRLKVLSGKDRDPFDNFDWLEQQHDQHNLKPIYFFLVAEKNGSLDKNILPSTKAMQQLIKKTTKKYSVGLHPSWQSGDSDFMLKKEKKILENAANIEITQSRQHYLCFNLPEGYRRLTDAGITDDYSMGYAASNGFRASTALSFFWYDLEKDQQTQLRIHPFCCMDSNAIYYQKLLPQDALNEMIYYFEVCKKFGGIFICIMHNHFLGTDNKEWKSVYEKFLENVMKVE